jgi:hypothetical protein
MNALRIATTAVLCVGALYSACSVLAYTLMFSPFAGRHALPNGLIHLAIVLLPYVLFFVAARLVRSVQEARAVLVAAALGALISVVLYAWGFSYNDAEYWLVYMFTPLLQSPLVLWALALTWLSRRPNAT